jgi:hypothetical protein
MSNMAREVRTNKNYYPTEGSLGLGSDANLYASTNAARSRFGADYGVDPQPYEYTQKSSYLSEIVPDTDRPSAFTSRYNTPPQLGSDASLSPKRTWSRDSAQTVPVQDTSYLNYLLPDTDRTSAFSSRFNELPILGSDALNSSPSRPRNMNYAEPPVLGSDASNSSPSKSRQTFYPNGQFSSQTLNPSSYPSSIRTPSQLSGIASGYGGDMGGGFQGQLGGGGMGAGGYGGNNNVGGGMSQAQMGGFGGYGGSMGQNSMGQSGMGGGIGMDNWS